ncbi:ATP-binding protein, partial [Patescibacteria group bacterium]|nr:ATP-binding protein [Patescibacteria group bacterium]
MDPQQIWKTALTEIEINVSQANFITWFKEANLSRVQDGCAIISVPNAFSRAWLENKYNKFILRALHNITPEIKEIQYVINQTQPKRNEFGRQRMQKKKFVIPEEEFLYNEQLDLKDTAINTDTNLNPKYDFTSFVVGSFNELANAAAQSVIKNLGSAYNPLFIYGGVGLGKTHLIQAIGNGVLQQNPNIKVKYLPAEKFMGEIVEAITNKTMNELKERYRVCDLLIMDDIQFIAGAEKMQEE